ncbi:HK97 family phage portal protein [Sphingobium wenxiniae]|uniref:HK97 family phage portal protein n=1 Tax=Sphingobium wenxiniae (strain DSM 21828 / CGMCC 1.7748 / JZ-1) TaxID=595605 RepID=A0A562KIX6_SPHWJ|nr:phage portal protein [Sphingobium wenxiniae]MBB6192865.1 HK97 family phage portal protein [Sphingobium wenxiniae]TWH95326.1 HK97 family phage portal protein [Sphingobium wenxiniae]
MRLADRFLSRLGYERRDASDPSWAALAPGIGYHAGVSARYAENMSAVLGCVNVIADSLASIPALVYRLEGENRIEALSHPLRRLTVNGVNEGMTWPEFIGHLVASTLLTGNGLAEIIRSGNGQLAGLAYIPWGMVTVAELASGRLAYDVSDGRGHVRRLLAGEVIHLRDRTDDGKIGVSRLSRAASAVEAVQLANSHASAFLANGASPSGWIEVPGTMKPDQRKELREGFQSRHGGAGNAGSTLVLDGGMKWNGVSLSPEDSELLETRKFGTEEICRLFQVPPPLVQDYSHNTFTNSETAGRWFAMFTLAPWARKIEAEFARSVFPTNGPYELELDLSGFLRGDPQTRWQAHEIALRNKVLDANEVRQIEGWNPRKEEPAGVRSPANPDDGKQVIENQGEQSHV